jgi:septal ring factor EnvC (AmiA/AmiB activator)
MLALQNQLAELSEAFQQAQEELAQYKKTNAEMSNLIRQSNDRIQGLTEQQGAPQQGGAPQQPMGGMQMDQADMNRMTGLMG